jgi:outer membrane protein TolC
MIEAVRTRFRPIMMTSLSTIAGMIPLAAEWALGAERFSPLAIAVIGGMTAATFLTMIIIPVLYDLLDGLGRRLRPGRGPVATILAVLVLIAGAGPARADAPVRLDLEQAVQMAADRSPGLRAAGEDVAAAGARERQARGTLLPRLDLVGRYSRLSEVEPGTLPVPTATGEGVPFGDTITNVWSARATVTQPLFDLRRFRSFRAAGVAVELSTAERDRATEDLRLEIAEAYLELARIRELEDAAASSVALLEAHLDQVRVLEDAGRALGLDRARVETRLDRALVRVADLDAAEKLASARIAILVGLPRETPIVLTESLDAGLAVDSVDELTRRGLDRRPELVVARTAVEVARRREGAERAGLFPTVQLQLGYSLANPHDRYVPPETEFHDSWDASLVLSWSLDWGVTRGAADATMHERRAAAHRAAALEDRTRIEIGSGHIAATGGDRAVRAAARAVDTAAEALRLAQELFAAGRVDSTEVVEREADLTAARAEHVEAQVTARLARARLRRLTGSDPSR